MFFLRPRTANDSFDRFRRFCRGRRTFRRIFSHRAGFRSCLGPKIHGHGLSRFGLGNFTGSQTADSAKIESGRFFLSRFLSLHSGFLCGFFVRFLDNFLYVFFLSRIFRGCRVLSGFFCRSSEIEKAFRGRFFRRSKLLGRFFSRSSKIEKAFRGRFFRRSKLLGRCFGWSSEIEKTFRRRFFRRGKLLGRFFGWSSEIEKTFRGRFFRRGKLLGRFFGWSSEIEKTFRRRFFRRSKLLGRFFSRSSKIEKSFRGRFFRRGFFCGESPFFLRKIEKVLIRSTRFNRRNFTDFLRECRSRGFFRRLNVLRLRGTFKIQIKKVGLFFFFRHIILIRGI